MLCVFVLVLCIETVPTWCMSSTSDYFFSVAQPLAQVHIPFLLQVSCACVQKQAVVMIRIHCDMMCNRRKHVFVGTGGFANQALTARLEG